MEGFTFDLPAKLQGLEGIAFLYFSASSKLVSVANKMLFSQAITGISQM